MGRHIKVNGYKLPINLADMAFLDRMVAANEAMQDTIASAAVEFPGDDFQAQYVRVEACVNATCKFFDEAFGEGTAQKVFRRTNDAAAYLKATQDFTRGLERIDKAFQNSAKYGTLKLHAALGARGLQKGPKGR